MFTGNLSFLYKDKLNLKSKAKLFSVKMNGLKNKLRAYKQRAITKNF